MDHDSTVAEVERLVERARRMLSDAADMLRGPLVEPSRAAMEAETAVTRSLDSLSGQLFRDRLARRFR
jgi:hypothetical protein